MISIEDKARSILARLGIEDDFTNGDLAELGNLVNAEIGLRKHLAQVLALVPEEANHEVVDQARSCLEWAIACASSRDRADGRQAELEALRGVEQVREDSGR